MTKLRELESAGSVKIWTPQGVYDAMIAQGRPEKEAKAVRAAMAKNSEILIEGQIPSGVLRPAK